VTRAQFAGAKVKVAAIAGIRATREAEVAMSGAGLGGRKDAPKLPCIIGTPIAGETFGGRIFDGSSEVAIFPGYLPVLVETGGVGGAASLTFAKPLTPGSLRFPKFRPPLVAASGGSPNPPFPHIRIDRALDFLIGDRLT
jgi:predicted YcjX-like family ATPase